MDIFQVIALNGECTRRHGIGPFPIIFIGEVGRLPVLVRDLAGNERPCADSFELRWLLDPGQVQEGRRIIEIAYPPGVDRTGRHRPRLIHDHRHAYRRLIGSPLVDQAMIADLKPVVGGKDDQRILFQPVRLQIGGNASNTVIDRSKRAIIIAQIFGHLHIGVEEEIDAVPCVSLVIDPHRLALVIFGRVGGAGRNLEIGPIVQMAVARRRQRVRMDRLVAQIQEERLALVAFLFQPVHGVVGQLIGNIALLRDLLAIHVPHRRFAALHGCIGIAARRIIAPLPPETDPFVKARTRRVDVVAHMPLADEGGLVTRLLQIGREKGQPGFRRIRIVDNAMVARGFARQDGRAAGAAQRRRDHRIGKIGAAPRQPVDIGGSEFRLQKAHAVIAQVIQQDENHIPRLARRFDLGGTGRLLRGARGQQGRGACRQHHTRRQQPV